MFPVMSKGFLHSPRLKQAAILFCLFTGCLFQGAATASPLLRCKIEQGGDTKNLEFSPVTDPYSVKAADINGSFRFKAVVIGDKNRIDYIKLYTYYRRGQRSVLLHQAHYRSPVAQDSPAPASLTGVNYLYSAVLERELQYECALYELQP